MRTASLLFVLFTTVAIANDLIPTKQESRAVETMVTLAEYKPEKANKIIAAIKERQEGYQDIGATFVRDAYNNQNHGLSTTECKIIWKAILLTAKTDQDGFELLEVETPWLNK